MKAAWVELCGCTSAMEVPGGVVIKHYEVEYDDARGRGEASCSSVALVFVPGVRLDCSEGRPAELIDASRRSEEVLPGDVIDSRP